MLQQPETTTQSPTPHKKRGDPARIAPFGSSLALRRVPSSFGYVHALRRLHHDRLCLDFEREARWWAYSASPALRDTFRRDAFPVGKPANTPRELLDSLEEL
jgi:hypothetical protein